MYGNMNVKLVIISYRSSGTTFRSRPQGSRIQFFWIIDPWRRDR